MNDVISELVLLANNIKAGDKRGRAEAWKVLFNWDQQTSSVGCHRCARREQRR